MLVSYYDAFVRSTDQSRCRPAEERLDIATYGLASEVGSVVAAIKKQLLTEGGEKAWNVPSAEVVEELGDVVWYLFALSHALSPEQPLNIFTLDIANLQAEVGAGDARAERIQGILDPTKRDEFLHAAENFSKIGDSMTFEDYQHTAFLTARTEDRTLVEVCFAVLWQLSAELFRRKLPDFERELNRGIIDRRPDAVLGEIAWHVAALASIFGLRLSDIAQKNLEKVRFRFNRDNPTPLHDEGEQASEQLPRLFEVGFVTIGLGKARMYLDGRQLGDDLTDNAYNEDGYRFHDVMHLANAAKLGWSPVLRSLMGRKRKLNPKKDEVEDGARAKIVEEAVIKAIHSEGVRLAGKTEESAKSDLVRLFPSRSDITFRFLKFINSFLVGLEVQKNRFWEWEDAICEGYGVFDQLCREGQGTIVIDLEKRSINFEAHVCVSVSGRVAGLGSAYVDAAVEGNERAQLLAAHTRRESGGSDADVARIVAQKLAILEALGIHNPLPDQFEALQVTEVAGKGISVKATGSVQHAMWDRRIVSVRTTSAMTGGLGCYCTAIAVTDG